MPLTPSQVEVAAQAGFLNEHDGVAISFWIISIAMVASTVFFLMEALTVKDHWKTSLHTGALVTLVAAVHYFYMREFWVKVHATPIVYRYIDWAITVPLQMIEFNLILRAAGRPVGAGMFWRLLLGTVMMLLFGFCGETYVINAWPAFILGMCGWFFILFEVFSQGSNAGDCSPAVQKSYATMRLIVSAGWSIYPAGYFVGYLLARRNLCVNFSRRNDIMAFCKAAILTLALATRASALGLKNLKERLDINQKVYIDGQPVVGDGTGVGSLNKCNAFADHFVSDPRKPDVKVCGTGIKMTVFLLGRCGQKSTGQALSTSGMAHTWTVGACDKGLDAKTCKEFGPSVDLRFGASQSYKIEQC